jgi:deazaflavin-dependent oxidoreductase (nitroreductase family)
VEQGLTTTMAKPYSPNRTINAIFAFLTRRGWGKAYRHLLTVEGRRSGRRYSVPVDVMAIEDKRYVVAPYGEVGWVRNVRAAGRAWLSRGGRTDEIRVRELSPSESVPVLRRYHEEVPVTRPYFDVTAASSDADFEVEATRHPSFEIIEGGGSAGG